MLMTYRIEKMRVYRPSAKVAEKHPDRLLTIAGLFYTEDGTKLSFTSKSISKDEAKAEGFILDVENGILTVPSGTKGRKAFESISQEDIDSMLDSLSAED